MRRSVIALVALGLAVSATPVFAAPDSPMKACAAQWQAMKKAGTDKGTTYKDFSKTCMSKGATTTASATTTTTTTAAAAPAAKKPSILSSMMAKKTATTTAAAPAATPAPAPVAVATTTKTTKTSKTTKAKTAKAEDSDPTGATANCKDGTYSHAKQHSGSCAGHGGVAKFLS